MTPIEELDLVLKIFAEWKMDTTKLPNEARATFSGVQKAIENIYGISILDKISTGDVGRIMLKLEKDGYIMKGVPINGIDPYWVVTFDGKLFYHEGGYRAMYAKLKQDRDDEEWDAIEAYNNARRLNWLTGALAVGTFALVFWDVWKYFHSCSCNH